MEADVLVPDPLFAVLLPKMVWSEVFLLGANTELKSCPIPCMVLQPATQVAITANAKSRANIFTSIRCDLKIVPSEIRAMAVPDQGSEAWLP